MIGVLALQGGYHEHQQMLSQLGVEHCQIRTPEQLGSVDGLIMPGGESTSMRHLMRRTSLDKAIPQFVQQGRPVWGSCAGAILLSRQAEQLPHPPLGLIDLVAQRNAFGRQIDSFVAPLAITGLEAPLEAIFIRAPVFSQLGQGVEPLATLEDGRIVAARSGKVMVTSFHPELGEDTRLHQLFVEELPHA